MNMPNNFYRANTEQQNKNEKCDEIDPMRVDKTVSVQFNYTILSLIPITDQNIIPPLCFVISNDGDVVSCATQNTNQGHVKICFRF